MEQLDTEDVVVAELDVLVSNELANLQSQLVMLQQPLRPNWRPYDTDRYVGPLFSVNLACITRFFMRVRARTTVGMQPGLGSVTVAGHAHQQRLHMQDTCLNSSSTAHCSVRHISLVARTSTRIRVRTAIGMQQRLWLVRVAGHVHQQQLRYSQLLPQQQLPGFDTLPSRIAWLSMCERLRTVTGMQPRAAFVRVAGHVRQQQLCMPQQQQHCPLFSQQLNTLRLHPPK
eukprot:GHUV01030798.1.p1 GENE.GHUV01030798.1~~GHUV01030798.1.p1  ORF type:complete len:229 (+),score=50.37 GHUV01030798.1:508-1194(+)